MRKYWAFISYSHKDSSEAKWVHRFIERWVIPAAVRKQVGEKLGNEKRIFPVFRDRDELPTSADLGQNLIDALDASGTLIVICSPNSAKSRWVNEEVLRFKRTGKSHRILPVIIDGVPNASGSEDSHLECFCPALRHPVRADGSLDENQLIEPLAADLRPEPNGDGRRNAVLKVIAALLEVPFDSLKQRDLIRGRWRRMLAASISLLILVMAGISLQQYQEGKVTEAENKAAQLLSLAEAHFTRLDYAEGRRLLEQSIDAKREVGSPPSSAQLALIYRTFSNLPGVERLAGVGSKAYLRKIANRNLLIPDNYIERLPIIDANTLKVISHLDTSHLINYLKKSGWNQFYLSTMPLYAAADINEGKINLIGYDRVFVFDLNSGQFLNYLELSEYLTAAGIVPKDIDMPKINVSSGNLLISFSGSINGTLLIDEKKNSRFFEGRDVAGVDESTNIPILESEGVVEVLLGNVLKNVYTSEGEISDVSHRGSLLSIANNSKLSGNVVDVFNLNTLNHEWGCELPEGEVLQSDPISEDKLLVLMDKPNILMLYGKKESECVLLSSYSIAYKKRYFNYADDKGLLALPGLKVDGGDSELLKVGDEIVFLSRAAFSMAEITPAGTWFAVSDGALIEIFPKSTFNIDSVDGYYKPSIDDPSLVFSSGNDIRLFSPAEDKSKKDILVGSDGLSPFFFVDEGGILNNEFHLNYSEDVKRKIIKSESSFPLDRTRNGTFLEEAINNILDDFRRGAFWLLGEFSYGGYIYGTTFSTLTRFDPKDLNVQLVPAPYGIHKLDLSSGKIWTLPFEDEGQITIYDPATGVVAHVADTSDVFKQGASTHPWQPSGNDRPGIIFGREGTKKLVYDVLGRWAIVQNQEVALDGFASHSIRIKNGDADASGQWIVTTSDKNLLRLSEDGRDILGQVPLNALAEKVVSYPELGLVVVGMEDGVSLRDHNTLMEVMKFEGEEAFHAFSDGQELTLAVGTSAATGHPKWEIYRLPKFGLELLSKIDRLGLAVETQQ